MATIKARRHCKTCGEKRLFEKHTTSAVFHLLMCVVTVGVWIPVWFLLAILSAFRPMRCPVCGEGRL